MITYPIGCDDTDDIMPYNAIQCHTMPYNASIGHEFSDCPPLNAALRAGPACTAIPFCMKLFIVEMASGDLEFPWPKKDQITANSQHQQISTA
jgi:hypothetical protein